MNDVEYVFNKTNRDRSALNPSSRKRKVGSKSKSCRLNSDQLSKKQLEEKNGPVRLFAMNMPCDLETLLSQDDDIVREYLEGLVEKYCFCQRNFTEMFHIGILKLNELLTKYGVTPVHGRSKSDDDVKLTMKFMARTVSPNRAAAENIIRTILREPETLKDSSEITGPAESVQQNEQVINVVNNSTKNEDSYVGNTSTNHNNDHELDLLSSIMKLSEFSKNKSSMKMKFSKSDIENALVVLRTALNDYGDDNVITIKVHI